MILLLLELRLFLACSFLLLLLHDEILRRGRSHTVVGGGPGLVIFRREAARPEPKW